MGKVSTAESYPQPFLNGLFVGDRIPGSQDYQGRWLFLSCISKSCLVLAEFI